MLQKYSCSINDPNKVFQQYEVNIQTNRSKESNTNNGKVYITCIKYAWEIIAHIKKQDSKYNGYSCSYPCTG